jgi:hypothetical protein
MPLYAHFFGEAKQIVNGQVVQDKAINSDYNGKLLHVDKVDNGKVAHFNIKDKELKKLLLTPRSKVNLLERLSGDYGKTRRHRKRTGKHKRSKRRSKRSHSKRSHSKRSHSKRSKS